jgi:hypothetical protein
LKQAVQQTPREPPDPSHADALNATHRLGDKARGRREDTAPFTSGPIVASRLDARADVAPPPD